MKFHIVQMNETIEKILFLYNLSKDELVEENRHIKRWDKLIPGTKPKKYQLLLVLLIVK